MRVTRSLLLLLGVAIAAAGCARQPVAYVAYSPTPATSGIDGVVYGTAAPPAPAVMAGRTYAMVPNAAAPYAASPYAAAPYAAHLVCRRDSLRRGAVRCGALCSRSGDVRSVRIRAPRRAGYGPQADAPPAVEGGYYTLDSGDRLRIVVFGQDGLTNSYVVGAGGYIDMPLIGSVAARGMTTDQLASRISDKLRDGFIREPHVAVEIVGYRPFFILGEVTQPGQYPYVANMTAETAVAIAGGFTPRALRKSVILNRNYLGRQVRMAVPLTFPLRPGDTINVQERWF